MRRRPFAWIRPTSDDRGAVAVLVVAAAALLCGSAALAVDLGNVAQIHSEGQNAVSDAAISGAELLGEGNVTDSAVVRSVESYVEENFSSVHATQWADCPLSSIPSGFVIPAGLDENCISFNGEGALNVALPPQAIHYTFGRALGLFGATTAPHATAVASGAAPCVLCVLGTSGTTLSARASGSLVVDNESGNAGIAVDSSAAVAASIIGSGEIEATGPGAPQIDLVGGYHVGGSARFSPTPVTGAPSAPDPLASLPAPNTSGEAIPSEPYTCGGSSCPPIPSPNPYGSISVSGSGSVTIPPGVYSSISLNGSGSITLAPGTYVLTGPLSMIGSGSIVESGGALLVFTCSSGNTVANCSSGQSGGSLSLTGSGSIDLSPDSTGIYTGMSVFYDRNNTAPITLTGSGGLNLSGTVYARSASLDLTGSGGAISSMFITNSVDFTGSGSVEINYNAATNISLVGTAHLCSLTANDC